MKSTLTLDHGRAGTGIGCSSPPGFRLDDLLHWQEWQERTYISTCSDRLLLPCDQYYLPSIQSLHAVWPSSRDAQNKSGGVMRLVQKIIPQLVISTAPPLPPQLVTLLVQHICLNNAISKICISGVFGNDMIQQ